MQRSITICGILLVFSIWLTPGTADEGMWLFNDLPVKDLKRTYGFEPTDEWAQHIMLSSVRFNSGGSASFVSSNGLVITNHHVAADTLHKLSTSERNFFDDGFLATTPADEVKAPDLELNQLISIEDVTDRVHAAVPEGSSVEAAFKARRAVMAEIEKESLEKSGLRSDVVTLYGGASYHLYCYKKYTDVRLVWAPESGIAFFGGDADNFEYPRYNLDATIFRVYEDDKPAKIEHFLKWSPSGAGDGELVFVSGNPGRTQRIFTLAALKYLRDHRLPYVLDYLRRMEILLQQFSLEGPEQQRRAQDDLLGVQNGRKAYTGMLQGLQNPRFMRAKEDSEKADLALLQRNNMQSEMSAWSTIAEVQQRRIEQLGMTASFRSRLYEIAENLVLMAKEDQKPGPERLRDFRDSARESLEQELYSPAPIYEDLELVKLADAMARFVELRGGDNPLVAQVLAGQSPRARAMELVQGTQLGDVSFRRQVAEGGIDGLAKANDPMIELALAMEDEYRRLEQINDELEERERQAYAKITGARTKLFGTSGYPDATFTLRLAFGTVNGYEDDGQRVPPWTTMGGTFDHELTHQAEKPWVLPASWKTHQDDIDSTTPFNFVCTADIIGGNSGSPVINQAGEFVGIIFDGNIQSLTGDYFYSDEVARAVSVHSAAIEESLRKIYGADFLADQLGN